MNYGRKQTELRNKTMFSNYRSGNRLILSIVLGILCVVIFLGGLHVSRRAQKQLTIVTEAAVEKAIEGTVETAE